jgi:phage tail tube protein FII
MVQPFNPDDLTPEQRRIMGFAENAPAKRGETSAGQPRFEPPKGATYPGGLVTPSGVEGKPREPVEITYGNPGTPQGPSPTGLKGFDFDAGTTSGGPGGSGGLVTVPLPAPIGGGDSTVDVRGLQQAQLAQKQAYAQGAAAAQPYTEPMGQAYDDYAQRAAAQQARDEQSNAKAEGDLASYRSRMQDRIKKIDTQETDPDHWWRTRDGYQQGMAVAGLMLGGFLQGFRGGTNPAYEMMDKAIDRDISAQRDAAAKDKYGLEADQNLYAQNLDHFKDEKSAQQATQIEMREQLKQQIMGIAEQSKNAQSIADAQKASADIDVTNQKAMLELSMKHKLRTLESDRLAASRGPAIGVGGGGAVRPSPAAPMLLPPKESDKLVWVNGVPHLPVGTKDAEGNQLGRIIKLDGGNYVMTDQARPLPVKAEGGKGGGPRFTTKLEIAKADDDLRAFRKLSAGFETGETGAQKQAAYDILAEKYHLPKMDISSSDLLDHNQGALNAAADQMKRDVAVSKELLAENSGATADVGEGK